MLLHLCVVDVAEKGCSSVVQEHRVVVSDGHPVKFSLVPRVSLLTPEVIAYNLSTLSCFEWTLYRQEAAFLHFVQRTVPLAFCIA